jgi:hypothetical protein
MKASSPDVRRRAGHASEKAFQVSASVPRIKANEAHGIDPPLSGLVALDSGARAGGARMRGGQVGRAAQEDEGREFLGMHVQKEFAGFGTFRGRV